MDGNFGPFNGENIWVEYLLRCGGDAPSVMPVAVISFGYWQSHFTAASTVIGQRISLNGIAFPVVGITPPGFFGLELGNPPEIYVPLSLEPRLRPASEALRARLHWWLNTMGRLRPGSPSGKHKRTSTGSFRNS